MEEKINEALEAFYDAIDFASSSLVNLAMPHFKRSEVKSAEEFIAIKEALAEKGFSIQLHYFPCKAFLTLMQEEEMIVVSEVFANFTEDAKSCKILYRVLSVKEFESIIDEAKSDGIIAKEHYF